MSITLTCPSCGQMCAVADEHAGKQVACPRCRGVISVPTGAGAAAAASPASAPAAPPVRAPSIPATPSSAAPTSPTASPFAFESAPTSAPPPPPGAPPRKAFAALDDAAQALGLDQFSKILLYAGFGC